MSVATLPDVDVGVDLDRELSCDKCTAAATTRMLGRCAGGHRLRREVCDVHALDLWRDWRDPLVRLVCTHTRSRRCSQDIIDVHAEAL